MTIVDQRLIHHDQAWIVIRWWNPQLRLDRRGSLEHPLGLITLDWITISLDRRKRLRL
jgi:hypothetical protein